MSKPPTKTAAKRSRGHRPHHRAASPVRHRRATSHSPEYPTQIYGIHAVEAALNNPGRDVHAIYLTKNAQNRLSETLERAQTQADLSVVEVGPRDLDLRLGADTVHQGALVECAPLTEPALAELMASARRNGTPLAILDQITDPHNVGAILRSCAVFGCAGVITTRRHSPPLAGTVAKSASGALELVPVALIQNLAKGLAALAEEGFAVIGLDGQAEAAIEDAFTSQFEANRPMAIVLGAEGRGLRQATQQTCTSIARIEAPGCIASLNVSNAAAVALHTHALLRRNALRRP